MLALAYFSHGLYQASTGRVASQMELVVKNPPASTGDIKGTDSIPGSERSPGEGNGCPLQYSCLENSMDRGVWWATVHETAKRQPWLKRDRAWAHSECFQQEGSDLKCDRATSWDALKAQNTWNGKKCSYPQFKDQENELTDPGEPPLNWPFHVIPAVYGLMESVHENLPGL